jgi:hypothetical protein
MVVQFFTTRSLRDAAVKHLALNARWQIRTLAGPGCPVIIFIDEPALAGFGSSELISISKEEILACLQEVVDAIHADGALAGIHVCANTDWSLVLESGADIVNFDAYTYPLCAGRRAGPDRQYLHGPGDAPAAQGRAGNRQDHAGPRHRRKPGMPLIVLNVKSSMKLVEALYQYDTLTRLNDSRFGDSSAT